MHSKTRDVRTAVILAAGSGTRIGELGKLVPKPLIPIVNEPLIRRILRTLRDLGVGHAEIVVGHLSDAIRAALADNPVDGLSISYTEQTERLGIAHALGQLAGVVNEPFMLVLGDYVFEAPELGRMLRLEGNDGCILSAKYEQDIESLRRNFCIEQDADGRVFQVTEKPQNPPNNLKGCGIYTFDQRVFDAIAKTPRSSLRNEYEITDTIQILIDSGVPARVMPVVTWDINLTYPADILACNLHFLPKARVSGLPASVLSKLPAGSVVEHSIIGRNVLARSPLHCTDSVVFDGAILEGPVHLTRSVVFGSSIIRC